MNRPASRLRRLAGLGTRFLIVGALSTLIEIAIFNLCLYVFGWDVVASKIVASLIALINAYIGNREWTFRHRDRRHRGVEIALFLGVNLACTGLGALLVWLGVEAAAALLGHAPGALAVNVVNLASIAIVVVIRFLLYHGLVFRTSSRPDSPSA